MLRLCLDVNVWVAYYLGVARGQGLDTAAGQLAAASFAGNCRLGPVQPIISHAMLDTLEFVLRRYPVTAPFAEMARDQIAAAAARGYLTEPPSIILGSAAANALLDQEDAAVLNAAMTGSADLLVTSNIGDFIRGPRARTDTTILGEYAGRPAVVLLAHPRIPDGLLIALPFPAAAWLAGRVPAPRHVQSRVPPNGGR